MGPHRGTAGAATTPILLLGVEAGSRTRRTPQRRTPESPQARPLPQADHCRRTETLVDDSGGQHEVTHTCLCVGMATPPGWLVGHPGGVLLSGDVLLSHMVPHAVPSALKDLTSGFGMEPGVSLSP